MKYFLKFIPPQLLLLLLLGVYSHHATSTNAPELVPYLVNSFTISNQNWSIAHDPNNKLIYIANSEGLIEYNGINWKKFARADKLPIRSVAVNDQGRVFTGSFEDFGYWEHNIKGELEYTSLAHLAEVEKNDEIWKIYIDNDSVYFQSFTTIYILNQGKVSAIKAPYAMLFLHQIYQKYVVQVIESGLYWFENQKFVQIGGSDLFSSKKVHAIIPYANNQWLVCTDNYGLYLYDGKKFSYFNSEASSFLENHICNAAKQLNDSTYAFGSILNGLIITNQAGEILRSYNINNGLKNNTVLSLYADSETKLWAGLDEGINFIDLLSPFTHYKSRNASLGTIYAMLKRDNKLYIGTNHGLFLSNIEKKGQFYHFTNLRLMPGSQGQVWSLEEFDNQIICGHNEGTFIVQDETLSLISSVTGGWSFKRKGERLLGGTYTGIIVYEKSSQGNWNYVTKIEGFSEPTRHLEIDYLGYIWASHHQKGLYKLELSEDLTRALDVKYFPSINGNSHNIKVFMINNRVVFTTSENIYTYDYVRSIIIPIDSLSSDLGEYKTATQIQHHSKNEYWLIKDNKLALFEIDLDFTARKKCEVQLTTIRLPQRSLGLVALDSNTLIIPTPDSFDTYNLALSSSAQPPSSLKLETITFYGKKDEPSIHFRSYNELKTKWNINNVTVRFIAPYSFEQPSKEFHYRIKELDKNWQTTQNNHFTYLGLKYGTYTIEVVAPDGSQLEIPFQVEKPWYYSNTAIAFYILLVLAIAWLLAFFIRHKMSRQKERIEMEIRHSNLEKELDYKNYELMLTIRYLINKNEILTELQKEIMHIKENSSKYPIKNLRSMENIINEGLETQTEEWMNAMKSLKLSEQGFFKRLVDEFPHLTNNDLRLCSYLRMNFSTKEIARLLNISTRAVEIGRYRLRKKLNLDHNVNLSEFLMNIDFSTSR